MKKRKDFLTLADLTKAEAEEILLLADKIKKNPGRFSQSLKAKNFVLIFEKPSLRTKLSFELGLKQMSANVVSFMGSEISLGRREEVKDIARTVSSYAEGVIIRTFSHRTILEFAAYSKAFVINALTDKFHPAQALSDIYTITRKKGDLRRLKIAFIGDGNNVCNSLINAASLFGFRLFVACPQKYKPDKEVLGRAKDKVLFSEPKKVAVGADILYTDVWTSMGKEGESRQRQKDFKGFSLTESVLRLAKKSCLVMHCLPAHRGEEITEEVIESKNSIVFEQAQNRLYVQKALLHYLARKNR